MIITGYLYCTYAVSILKIMQYLLLQFANHLYCKNSKVLVSILCNIRAKFPQSFKAIY